MGVFENVEVLGLSGADLEAELLHHETSPGAEGADDPPHSPSAGTISPADAIPPAEPESPASDEGSGTDAEMVDGDAQAPQQ